jgi:hypothetical protein
MPRPGHSFNSTPFQGTGRTLLSLRATDKASPMSEELARRAGVNVENRRFSERERLPTGADE